MAARDRQHIFVPSSPAAEPFTLASSGGGGESEPFKGNRSGHGRRLKQELENAFDARPTKPADEGTYITFVSFPGLELALESLDPQRKGDQPELVAVSELETDSGTMQMATVYIPDGKKEYFLNRLTSYVESLEAGNARHSKLVEGIQSIRRATIRELWTDSQDLFPEDPTESRWWEVWLRKRDGRGRERFGDFAVRHGLRTSEHYLGFGDRTVVLLRASGDELAQAFDSLDDLAELRMPHEVANLLAELPAAEQAGWVDDLRNRLQVADKESPAICVLDTGVQDTHPLLTDSLSPTDLHLADQAWSLVPTHGHGTEMAGLALFGDLYAAVLDPQPVSLRHRLESVKFLPDKGDHDPDLYGAVTARSVDRPEIQSTAHPRVFMLAITAPRHSTSSADSEASERIEAGKPTSWSATIDALTFGRAIDDSDPSFTYLDRDEPRRPRLFVISAGNIRDVAATDDHLARSDVEPVEDPAQSWNALTVGAYSATDDMSGAPSAFAGYTPIAPRGELAPVSRTSVVFDRRKWPFKPDVVADGGNVAASPGKDDVDTPENLAVFTTRLQKPGEGFFTTTRDTSAATAQVAAIAADIYAAYPTLRPETVRALIVHSAEWTNAMKARFDSATGKTAMVNLLRRYGMGVPDSDRAIHSATDALTLVAQSQIHPYEHEGGSNQGTVREMNLHEFPWPANELEQLGEAQVSLRVTLSYFIEPNPSSRGWTGRYVYPSHGLRFATKRPEESVDSFRRRINTKAREDGSKPPSLDTEAGWLLGRKQQEASGSLHTDIWAGTAADLASRGAIAVYPVAGWWKNRGDHDQSELGVTYTLVVSIESPKVEVDLWTPVAQQVADLIEITT